MKIYSTPVKVSIYSNSEYSQSFVSADSKSMDANKYR